GRCRGILSQRARELRQRIAPRLALALFGARERLPYRLHPQGREAIRALELIDVRARDDEGRRPGHPGLILRVEIIEMHELRRRDLVGRDQAARLELEYVEPARNLRAVDVAVVPVRRPCAGVPRLRSVDGSAVEERDLPGMRRVGPIEDRDPTLI